MLFRSHPTTTTADLPRPPFPNHGRAAPPQDAVVPLADTPPLAIGPAGSPRRPTSLPALATNPDPRRPPSVPRRLDPPSPSPAATARPLAHGGLPTVARPTLSWQPTLAGSSHGGRPGVIDEEG